LAKGRFNPDVVVKEFFTLLAAQEEGTRRVQGWKTSALKEAEDGVHV
jgi:hypothetical protein